MRQQTEQRARSRMWGSINIIIYKGKHTNTT